MDFNHSGLRKEDFNGGAAVVNNLLVHRPLFLTSRMVFKQQMFQLGHPAEIKCDIPKKTEHKKMQQHKPFVTTPPTANSIVYSVNFYLI